MNRHIFGSAKIVGLAWRLDVGGAKLTLAAKLRAREPSLNPLTLFQEPELFLSLFVRDPAASVYATYVVRAAGMLQDTPAALPQERYLPTVSARWLPHRAGRLRGR